LLLIRGILAALRQKIHLATCPSSPGHLSATLAALNALLLAGTGGVALWLWTQGSVSVAALATALPLGFFTAEGGRIVVDSQDSASASRSPACC